MNNPSHSIRLWCLTWALLLLPVLIAPTTAPRGSDTPSLPAALDALDAAIGELQPSSQASADELPRRSVPSSILELLPSSARLPSQTPDVAAAPSDWRPQVRVERIAQAGRPGDWLEVTYTVNPELEELVQRELTQGRVALGHVIVLDPSDGRVLAYVSTDPKQFPATGIYPTASLMKVVTAGAVLRIAPNAAEEDCRYSGSPYHLTKSRLRPPKHGGRVDNFWRSLAISNNQCFARLAVDHVGPKQLVAEMSSLGLLEAPAPGHSPGIVEPLESDLDLGELGSGLAGSFISPLAAARMAAVLADGSLVRPYWLEGVRDAEGRELRLPDRESPRAAWPQEVSRALRELLVGTTARGTAKSAFRNQRGQPLLGPVKVSGKTGRLSGRNPTGRYEWFIGVAPTDAPRIAIATVVVNGDLWWTSASQLAARVLEEIFCERGRCRPEALTRWSNVGG